MAEILTLVFNPSLILKGYGGSQQEDGTVGIYFRNPSDYTHSIDVVIDDKKANLTVSVYQSSGSRCTGRRGAYSLGELDTLIRLSFEEAQDINSVTRYYCIIQELISILTRQRNVSFDAYLSQIDKNGEYYPSAVCKIFNRYENYAEINHHKSISIYKIFEFLPNLLKKICANDTQPLLDLLPSDNRNVKKISITNIQDMCTALEAAYPKQKREKDALITELKKEIKKTIKAFQQSHTVIDVNSETTWSNCFQHVDFNLRNKILTMYNDNNKFIDPIIQKYHLPPFNNDTVGAFVNLRNNKTHGGAFELDDSVNIYVALLAIVYIQLFKSIGISDEKIESIIYHLI